MSGQNSGLLFCSIKVPSQGTSKPSACFQRKLNNTGNFGRIRLVCGCVISDIQSEILIRMRNAFRQLKEEGKLQHGSGTFDYGDWAVWISLCGLNCGLCSMRLDGHCLQIKLQKLKISKDCILIVTLVKLQWNLHRGPTSADYQKESK